MPPEKETQLKFHDGHHELKVPFLLYTEFKRIFLKPVDDKHREKMNKMKTE